MRIPGRVQAWAVLLLSFTAVACASQKDAAVEEARFLLDQGKYAEAAAKVQPVVTDNPRDEDATFLLASALMGQAMLGDGGTYLGKLGDVLEAKDEGETGLGMFGRIAPDSADVLDDLTAARDLLVGLTDFVSPEKARDAYFQLYLARMFEISGAITRIGANTPKEVCNAASTNPLNDDVPDGYTGGTELTDDSEARGRFLENLENLNSDGENAGLPSSFGLNETVENLVDDLNDFVGLTGGLLVPGMTAFLNDQFNYTGDAATDCTL